VPSAPKRRCPRPGCREFVPCGEHKPGQRSARAAENHKLYNTPAWRRASKAWLAAHPLCVECEREGSLKPANQVDHIKRWDGDLDLFWDSETNWQSLCHSHHSAKTWREMNGTVEKRA
jgi:5-methylcytosine-specific restriction protein A